MSPKTWLRAAVLTAATVVCLPGPIMSGEAVAADISHRNVGGDLEAIIVSGTIVAGDDAKFRKLSVRFPEVIVILDSDGGALLPALEIGKLIRLAGYGTIVGDGTVCTSSCALVWLAGSPRLLSPKGRVGFHASYRDNKGKLEETGVGNAMVGHYLTLLNLPQKAIIFATMASPHQISWLSASNRQTTGIDFQDFAPEDSPVVTVSAPPPVVITPTAPPPIVRTVVEPNSNDAQSTAVSLQDLTRYLKAYVRSPANVQRLARSMGLPAAYSEILKTHMQALYAEDRLIEYMAKEAYASRSLITGGAEDTEIGKQIGQAAVMKLAFSGISRLGNEDIRLFFYYFSVMPKHLTPERCREAFSGKSSSSTAEFSAFVSMGQSGFSKYLGLIRRGIKAELSDYPVTVPLTRQQDELGNKNFENALVERLKGLPSNEKARIAEAMQDLDSATAKDMCDSYQLIFETMHNLEGMVGDWYRRSAVRNLAQ